MSPAEAAEKLTLRTDFSLLIDGQSVGAAAQLDVINPATGEVFARCPAAGKAELDRAVAAARRAFSSWSELSFEDRTTAIQRMANVLKANADMLAGAAHARAGQAGSAIEGRDQSRGHA